jgi:hypothetical protein
MRFTIRSVMIAVVLVAIPLALPDGWGIVIAALSLAYLSVIGAGWMIYRGWRRQAAVSFWTVAASSNALYAGCCIAPDYYLLIFLLLGWMVIIFPAIIAFGAAWAILASRPGAFPRRSGEVYGLVVFLLASLPVLTLGTLWPLRMAFVAARPTLERLADQVAAGQTVNFPQQAGPFRLVKSAVDPVSGHIALMTDPNTSGPKGFVRVRPASPSSLAGPIVGSNLDVGLGGEWDYRDED